MEYRSVPGTFEFLSNSEADTRQLGCMFASSLQTGLVVALDGNLGAGKTNFVRAVGAALGADESLINSPTFVLLQCYEDCRIPIAHFDTYRLADVDEFIAIGGDEFLSDSSRLCFVEWATRILDVFPEDFLAVKIDQVGESERRFSFAANGPKSAAVLSTLSVARGNCEN